MISTLVSIGNHTHSSPIWEIIVLAILKIVSMTSDLSWSSHGH